jgi:peptidoglycan/xylan/chitin deacetylase (PgdA/CDA1 family)
MSGIWPGDLRCVVSLGFDVDGVSGAINRNPDSANLPSLMSMREYGPSVGTPRILDLLDDYDIKASFFVPGYIAETHEELVLDIKNRGHEIAHHGYMHEPPATLSKEQEEEVLDKGISIIERITGEKPKGYRSPSWELSEHSLSLLADRGFAYDSSLMGDDIPYMVDANGSQIVEIPIHWELDDAPYFSYAPSLGARPVMASPEHVYQVWSAGFEGMYHYGRSFVLTMHPFVIGRPGRLRMLERLIRYIREFRAVEFMRAIDLAEMTAAQQSSGS